jgi:8-oxo-dGTP pyrophosphatase MutT (NUDIX family)
MSKQRKTRSDTCAGGVVYRRVTGRVEIAVAIERDRLRGLPNTRLAKGHVEAGEPLEAAALREVREELGIVAEIVAPLGSVAYTFREDQVDVSKIVHFYLMRATGGETLPLDGEMQHVYWCPIETAVAELTFDTEQRIARRARAAIADTERLSADGGT